LSVDLSDINWLVWKTGDVKYEDVNEAHGAVNDGVILGGHGDSRIIGKQCVTLSNRNYLMLFIGID